jgi:PKD repeat protein
MRGGLRAVCAGLVPIALAAGGCNEGDTITNTPPTLSATCSASPTSGVAPLDVAFALGVAGAEGSVTVSISYGDGATGSNPDVNHTYAGAGLFTASFDVRTPTQSARCAVNVEVTASASGGGTSEDNEPPVADFRTGPGATAAGKITGTAPFTVNFNMCRTYDPEGDPLRFTMDLNGNGQLNVGGSTGASCRQPWTYAAGTWSPKICVTDLGSQGQTLHRYQCRTYTIVAS